MINICFPKYVNFYIREDADKPEVFIGRNAKTGYNYKILYEGSHQRLWKMSKFCMGIYDHEHTCKRAHTYIIQYHKSFSYWKLGHLKNGWQNCETEETEGILSKVVKNLKLKRIFWGNVMSWKEHGILNLKIWAWTLDPPIIICMCDHLQITIFLLCFRVSIRQR